METLDFQNKKWMIRDKIPLNIVDGHKELKSSYNCDLVLQNKSHYFILDELIDAEFEEIK